MTAKLDIEKNGYTNVNDRIIGLDEFYEEFFCSEDYITWYRRLVVIQETEPRAEEDHRRLFKPIMFQAFIDFCEVLDEEVAQETERRLEIIRERFNKQGFWI